MKRRTVMLSVVAAMLVFATAAFAQGGMMGGMGPMMMGLNLNADQQAKIAQLRVKNQIDMVELNAQIKKLHLLMKQELMKPEPSKKEILALVDKVNALKAKVARKRIDHLFAMKGILTPEQWQKVAMRFPMFHKGRMGGCGMEGCMGMRGKGMAGPGMMGGWKGMKKDPGCKARGTGRMMQGM